MNLLYDKRHSATSVLTAAVSAYRFVGFDGSHATQAGGQHDAMGVSEQAGIAGQLVSLVTSYSYPVEAAGAIAVGDFVGPSPDGTGRAVNVGVAGGQQFGRALTAATTAGEQVVVAFASRAAGATSSQAAAQQTLVSGAWNAPQAVRASRGYVVAADLRAANIAGSSSCTITDVERAAPDGTRMRGIRMTANAGTSCSVDLTIRSMTFATGRVSALVYADPASAGGLDPNMTLWVGDGASFTNSFNRNGAVASSRGWNLIAPGDASGVAINKWAVGAGAPVWGTTNFVRLRLRLDYSAAQTPWVELYEVHYNEDAPRPWVSLTVDDGYDSAYTLGAPMMERYGLRGSFSVIADKVGQGGYMTLDQLQDLVARGHECVVHGPLGGTGSLNNYSAAADRYAAVLADVSYHRDYLIANGLATRGSQAVYVYPQGFDRFSASDDNIRNALEAAGFVGGRRAAAGRQGKRNTRGSGAWTVPVVGHLWTTAPAEAANITAVAAQINSAATEKYDATLMLHKFVSGAAAESLEINISDFETLLRAIADNQLAGTQEPVLFSRLVYSAAGLQLPVA